MSSRVPLRHILILAMALCSGASRARLDMGGATHHYIAQNYSMHLPASMDGLRSFDGIVDQKVNDPDARRSSTPGEAPRHYIDIDFYPEFFTGTLPHDRVELEALYGAETVLDKGILPWAVAEVVTTLMIQLHAEQWNDAATTIADLCHYVGDATQSLHCTVNYNGQFSGNSGIHSRYESTMMSGHIGELSTLPTPVAHFPSTVEAMFDIVSDSWSGLSTVLDADDAAKAASGGAYNSTYYSSLWASTESLTRGRVNTAAVATAAFVYTAWVNAGRPPVPGSSAAVEPVSTIGTHFSAGPSPFRDALTIRYAGAGPLSIDVFDVRGSRVERVLDHGDGEGSVTWRPTPGIAPGLYFLRLTGPARNIVRRVTRIE